MESIQVENKAQNALLIETFSEKIGIGMPNHYSLKQRLNLNLDAIYSELKADHNASVAKQRSIERKLDTVTTDVSCLQGEVD